MGARRACSAAVKIEYRWAEGRYAELPALAADLVNRKVELIMASSPPSALAAGRKMRDWQAVAAGLVPGGGRGSQKSHRSFQPRPWCFRHSLLVPAMVYWMMLVLKGLGGWK
jgi:hypothetical protein